MSIVESDGPPCWSLDVSETGESTRCLWVGVMGLKGRGEGAEKNRETMGMYFAIFRKTPCGA